MKMRKIILASLMVATVAPLASPVMAQDSAWTRNRTSNGQSAPPRNNARDDRSQREQPVVRQQQAQPPRQNYRERASGDVQRAPQARAVQDQQARVIQQRSAESRQNWQNGAQDRRDDRQDRRGDRRDDRQDVRRDDRRADRQDRRYDNRNDRVTERRADWNNRRDGNRTFGDVVNENRRWDGDRNGNRNDWRNGSRDRDRLDERNRWSNQRRWSNDWRSDRRYDWRSNRNRYGSIYRPGRYYAPRGWSFGYQSFSSGYYADSLLYSQNYWIDNPGRYRLPPAYGSMRWVRYYDDALLIDMRDGYVVDVIRDFFW